MVGAASEPFFIVGSARSGTTLLRMLFNAHPEVTVPPESRFIVEFYSGADTVNVDEFLARLVQHKRFQNWDLPIESIRARLEPRATMPYVEMIEAVYETYAEVHGKSRWGDKTPRYIESMPLLSSLFPGARFIHIIRDGREVALSYADVPFGPKTVARAADLWARRVTQGIDEGRRLGLRYTEVRYEELVEDIETCAKELCAFLELDFDRSMLEYTERARSDVLPTAARFNPNVTKKPIPNVRSWERDMPDAQVRVFEAVAGNVLATLGYPRRHPDPGMTARVAARLALWGLPLGRLGNNRRQA